MPRPRLRQIIIQGLLLTLLGSHLSLASAQRDRDENSLPVLDFDTPLRLNFSGNWEKDFARSDRWEDELDRQLRLRQETAALQQAGIRTGTGPAVSLGNLNIGRNSARGANLIQLAQLAEYINRQSTLQITQDRNQVRIERSGEAPLICGLEDGAQTTFESAHGTEICGWENQQLVFLISLPGNIVIQHRFSVDANREQLRMVTSVNSNGGTPFNLIQAFNRYDVAADELNCIVTVSRGRVCSQVTPLQ